MLLVRWRKKLGEELMGNLDLIDGALGLLKSVDLTNEKNRETALDTAGIIIRPRRGNSWVTASVREPSR